MSFDINDIQEHFLNFEKSSLEIIALELGYNGVSKIPKDELVKIAVVNEKNKFEETLKTLSD